MGNFFRSLFIISAVAAIFLIAPTAGCTEVDDRLGINLLPDDQQMTVRMDTVRGVDTYLAASDSIPTGRLGRMLIGRMKSPRFGLTECGTVLQFVPSYTNNPNRSNPYGGHEFTIDSVELILQIENIYGDNSVKQKFYAYRFEPREPLLHTTSYYHDYDAESAIDRGKPLFSFFMENEEIRNKAKKLAVEPEGEKFLRELIALDTMVYTQSDTVFRKMFQGLYIAPSNDPAEAPENAAIYDISPLTYTIFDLPQDAAYLMISGHTHKKDPTTADDYHDCGGVPKATEDTVYVTYSFDDSGERIKYPNTSVVVIKHDYTGSDIDVSKFIDPLDFDPATAQQADPTYVQGMLGVSTYLHFNDDFLNSLRTLARFPDGTPAAMMINKAMLIFNLEEDADADEMDDAHARLGMYYAYKGTNPENIPDYMYQQEALYSGFKSAYGGLLNRALKRYEMDVSMYVRALVNDPETPGNLWLSPALPIQFQGRETVIRNTKGGANAIESPEIQLRLVYTLMPKN